MRGFTTNWTNNDKHTFEDECKGCMNWITNSWTNESWSRISIVRRSSKIISISTIKPLQSNEGEANPFIASIVRTYVKEYKLGYIKYSKKNYIVHLIALDYFSLNTIDSKHVIKCVYKHVFNGMWWWHCWVWRENERGCDVSHGSFRHKKMRAGPKECAHQKTLKAHLIYKTLINV